MGKRQYKFTTPEQQAQIKACRGVYRPSDIAAHFNVSTATVWRIWQREDLPEVDAPYMPNARATNKDIVADTQILLDRGMSLKEVAAYFRVRPARIRAAHRQLGVEYHIRESRSLEADGVWL